MEENFEYSSWFCGRLGLGFADVAFCLITR